MNRLKLWLLPLALLVGLNTVPAFAQVTAPQYKTITGNKVQGAGVTLQDPATGNGIGLSGLPLHVQCDSGCGGSGGTSAINDSTYANTSSFTNTPAGALVGTSAPTYTTGHVSPLSLTTGGALRVADPSVVTALGSPFQAGASIGNTAFGATQSGTWNVTNVSGTISLPTGAATSALQTSGNASLSALAAAASGSNLNVICTSGCGGGGGSGYSVLNTSTYANTTSFSNVPSGGLVATSAPTYTTGQASPISLTTGGALRVSDSALGSPFQAGGSIGNTTFGATQSGTWNITNVSGTVSLPTGAATSALQTTGNTSLGTLVTNTTGLATAAAQTTGNGSLSTIATNTTNAGAPSIASDSTGNVKLFQANASAALTISTATTTQLVALTSAKKIYVTAYNFIASGTTTVTFVTGTGTNCATGQSSLTGAMDFTAQNGMAFGAGVGPVMVVPAGQALCITNSAAFKVAGIVSYTVAP